MRKIPAITLHQPWATLIALGAKQVETRSWPTNYRGPLAIHAAKRFPLNGRCAANATGYLEILEQAGYLIPPVMGRLPIYHTLPLGAVVAVVSLVDCVPILFRSGLGRQIPYVNGIPVLEQERRFGGYLPGRHAWIVSHVVRLPEPIPVRGNQGLWTWHAPDDVAGLVEAAVRKNDA